MEFKLSYLRIKHGHIINFDNPKKGVEDRYVIEGRGENGIGIFSVECVLYNGNSDIAYLEAENVNVKLEKNTLRVLDGNIIECKKIR